MSAIQTQWPSVLKAHIQQDVQDKKEDLRKKGLSSEEVDAIFTPNLSAEELTASARSCMERINDFVFRQQLLFSSGPIDLSLSAAYQQKDEYGYAKYNFKVMKFQEEVRLMLREEQNLDVLSFREGHDSQVILTVQRLYAEVFVP